MAGYIGTKAVNLSTTGADINGNANVDGTLDVTGAFTSLGIDDNATSTAITIDASENVGIGTAPAASLHVNSGAANLAGLFESTDSGVTITLIDSSTTGGSAAEHGLNAVGDQLELRAVDNLSFETADAERLRIDASGNVGIGTASPSSIITSAPRKGAKPTGNSIAIGLNLFNDQDNVTNDGVEIRFDHSFDTPAAQDRGAFIRSVATSGYSGAVDLAFGTSSANTLSEALRIDSSGNVLVGSTASSGGKLKVEAGTGSYSTYFYKTNTADEANMILRSARSSGGTAATMIYFMNSTGGGAGSITTTGSSTAFNATSDYRLKENITPIQGAADIIKSMRPVTYNFKADSTDWHDGFLAHELQELHPRAVIGSKDAMQDEEYEVTPEVLDEDGAVVTEAVIDTRSVPDYQGVDYSKLTPILTAALKEALTKIDALEAQNATFETRLAALEATP